jgi:hypothetical protein
MGRPVLTKALRNDVNNRAYVEKRQGETGVSIIANPLAGEKLTKKCLKLVKKVRCCHHNYISALLFTRLVTKTPLPHRQTSQLSPVRSSARTRASVCLLAKRK